MKSLTNLINTALLCTAVGASSCEKETILDLRGKGLRDAAVLSFIWQHGDNVVLYYKELELQSEVVLRDEGIFSHIKYHDNSISYYQTYECEQCVAATTDDMKNVVKIIDYGCDSKADVLEILPFQIWRGTKIFREEDGNETHFSNKLDPMLKYVKDRVWKEDMLKYVKDRICKEE